MCLAKCTAIIKGLLFLENNVNYNAKVYSFFLLLVDFVGCYCVLLVTVYLVNYMIAQTMATIVQIRKLDSNTT